MNRFAVVSLVIGGMLGLAPVQGATKTWTGALGNWDYGAAGNWSPSLPANNDWQDIAVLGASATPGIIGLVTPFGTSDMTPQHEAVRFDSAGWTLNVDFQDLGYVSSTGAGTNTINYGFEVQQASTWTIGAGNTLAINGVLYERNYNNSIIGGGTLKLNQAIGGFSSGTWGFHIKEGSTLRIDAASPYTAASSGKAYIFDGSSKLELKTTVAAATALIGTRIIDETGQGLSVRDIGGGYVQVYVPEPATVALVSIVGLGGLMMRPRRRA